MIWYFHKFIVNIIIFNKFYRNSFEINNKNKALTMNTCEKADNTDIYIKLYTYSGFVKLLLLFEL